MKPSHFISPLLLSFCLVGCSGPDESTSTTTDSPKIFGASEDSAKEPGANISHENGWAIVSKTENGDQVYWFVAPDVDKVSPAQYKKTIHINNGSDKEIKIVSKCEAPKQTCDDLAEQFKTLSEKYN